MVPGDIQERSNPEYEKAEAAKRRQRQQKGCKTAAYMQADRTHREIEGLQILHRCLSAGEEVQREHPP